MTEANIRIVSSKPPKAEAEEESSLRDRVNHIIDERRRRTVDLVTKTIVYHTELGHTELYVDELPGVMNVDRDFIVGYLQDEGFVVCKRRFGNRPVVSLLRERE